MLVSGNPLAGPDRARPGTAGHGRARWTMRWKPALNAFAITFADRFPAAETYKKTAGDTVNETVPTCVWSVAQPESLDRLGQVAHRGGVAGLGLSEKPHWKEPIVNIKKIVIGGAATATLGLAALAGTGTAFAAGNPPVASTGVSSTVQQGDQSAPDPAASAQKAGVETATESDGPGGHADANGVDVQQGDQSAPDTATLAETAGNETGVSDGPGGHADAAGSNVDHQFAGNE